MKKVPNLLLSTMVILSLSICLVGVLNLDTAFAAPDFSGCYVKEHPNTFVYYNELDGKTIVFDNYDSDAELFEGEKQPYNYYELAYWNPDEVFISSSSSDPSVAEVQDQLELYGDFYSDGGHFTSIIKAKKAGTTTITVRETVGHFEPTEKTYTFTVVVTDKWYSDRLRYNTNIKHANVYRNSKRVKVTIKNVFRGDKVTIKVGNSKKITKKIKKDMKSVSYNIYFKSQAAGRKVVINVYNKKGAVVKNSSKTIYYASKIKRGLTKKQVKLIPGWGSPQNTSVDGKYTIWWYNNYSKYVKFKSGKVFGWGE